MTSHRSPVRTGVAGLGDIGRKQAALLAAHRGAELVAVVDHDPFALALAKQERRVPFAFESVEPLLRAHDVGAVQLDALVVCLPTALHAPVTCAALERGIHVLCESPVAESLEAAEAIAEAERRHPGRTMHGFFLRHHPEVLAQCASARAGLGRLLRAEIRLTRRDGVPDRPAFAARALSGGGPVNDLLPHALAVLGDVVGRPPVGFATGTAWPPLAEGGDEVEHVAFGTLAFARGSDRVAAGATVSIEVSWRARLPREEPDESWAIRLIGTDGAVTLRLPVGAEAVQPAYAAQLDLFLARVRGETSWARETLHALWTQRAVEGLYLSMLNDGVPVRMADGLPDTWVELA